MEMPKPGPGHAMLQKFAGNWEGEETMYPSQWDPAGGTATGRNNYRSALNGFVMIGDYEQERGGVITFTGHAVISFDPKSELYTIHWFDSMGFPPEVFTGRFEGNRLTVAHGGPEMHVRLTHDMSVPQWMGSKMEMSQDGVAWKTMFDARYTKRP